MQNNIDISGLPALPQCERLRTLAAELWADTNVVALWLGGSLARGMGDRESDVDLRVALLPEAYGKGDLPTSARAVSENTVIAFAFPWGEEAVLHHMMLRDGDIYDLLIQSSHRDPDSETRLVLGCRDTGFAAKLTCGEDPAPTVFAPADPETMHDLLLSLWMGQRKHLKVLQRGLPLVAWEGEHRLRQDLLRVWFALTTGTDCGPINRLTIHTISPVVRAVEARYGAHALALLGGPLGTVAEIETGARQTQNKISEVGRFLAARLGFTYPDEAESTVRRLWEEQR